MSSPDSPRQPQSLPTRTPRAKGARRLAVFLVALCFFAASASLFLYVRGRAAATTFYSQGSLPPEVLASWSTTRDGVGGTPPTSFTNGDVFVIQNTHNMSTLTTWSVSGSGSKVEIESGGTLTANNAVTLGSTTTFQIDGGGTYVHNNNSAYGSTIFKGTESFAATSTVILNNSNTTGPSGVTFGNLTINFTTDPGTVNCSGRLTTVNGKLTVTRTQSHQFRLAATPSHPLSIGGDLIVQGGTLNLASSTAAPTINLAGNLTLTGGTLTQTGSNTSTFNFTGGSASVVLHQTGGTLTDTQINWAIASGKTVQFGVNGSSLAFTNAASRTFDINGTLLDAVQINSRGTMNVSGEFRLSDGGFATGNAFVYSGAATLAFASSDPLGYGVNNDPYWPTTNGPANVNVLGSGVNLHVSPTVSNLFQTSAAVTLNTSTLTLNGTCQINAGGFFNNSPTYGSSSLLKYNIGGPPAYGRNNEWTPGATSQPGYPANVQLSANTTLNLPNGSTTSPFQMSGTLTVDSGSTLDMGAMSPPLTVLGDLSLGGTLSLSSALGGGFKLAGNWTRAAAATFTPNTRAVFFNGSGAQTVTVTGGGTQAFDYLVVDKASGNLSPSSVVGNETSLSVTQTTGNVLQLVNSGGIDLNGQTFTLSGDGGNILVSGGARNVT